MSRSPNMNFNGSGYFDATAREAIRNADSKQLREKRRRTMEKITAVALENGFRICSYVRLEEVTDGNG